MAPRTTPAARQRVADPLLSLVVPVLDEEEAVGPFVEAVAPLLDREGLRFELVFVDDGSTDATVERLIALMDLDPRITVVTLSRNFGKEAALSAGLQHARGDAVIPIDVDLQDPPELIPEFVARWRAGYDCVYGRRARRDADSRFKRLSAAGFYRLFNRLSRENIPPDAGDYRLLDRKVVDVLNALPETNRFMKGLFSWVGFRSIGVPYERPPRRHGDSKWSYWRLWNFALDGFVGFTTVPLRLWLYVGAFVSLFAFVYAVIIVVRVLIDGVDVPGYASLITVVLFFGGVQLLSLGIIGEYLARLFVEVKGRPAYVVDAVLRAPSVDD